MKFYNAMKHYLAVVLFAVLFFVPAKAQQQDLSPEQREKKMYEYIDSEVERLTSLLKLDEGQQFYVTMTLTDCMQGLQNELINLQSSGVQNTDIYQTVQDKWMEKIDREFESYLTPAQWKKYLRSGAERAQKARDKRREKAEREGILKDN